MDIDFGKIKAKFGGSSAGHNGIESIDKFIGKDYSRVRIGIGHPKQRKKLIIMFWRILKKMKKKNKRDNRKHCKTITYIN